MSKRVGAPETRSHAKRHAAEDAGTGAPAAVSSSSSRDEAGAALYLSPSAPMSIVSFLRAPRIPAEERAGAVVRVDSPNASDKDAELLRVLELSKVDKVMGPVGALQLAMEESKRTAATSLSAPAPEKDAAAAAPASMAAVSSSSSSSAGPRTEYYYVIPLHRSFSREMIIADIEALLQLRNTHGAEAYKKTILCDTIRALSLYSSNDSATAESIFQNLKGHYIIKDVSRTNGDTTCPLTAEEYENAHILHSNGRSYSGAALDSTMDATLRRGQPLRLDDGTTIVPETASLEWSPNYSLGKWSDKKFSFEDIKAHARFDRAKVYAHNILPFSAWATELFKDDGSGRWVSDKLRELYSKYKERRGEPLAPDCGDTPLLENLELSGIHFPAVSHPKPGIIFKNVLFHSCFVQHGCYCSLRFHACRFSKCVVYVGGAQHEGWWQSCEFLECVFLYCADKRGELSVPVSMVTHGGVVSRCTTLARWTDKEITTNIKTLSAAACIRWVQREIEEHPAICNPPARK